ncbi:MAG: hypothetical protein KAR40_13990 [Candidatus Sabulitectum sp.]|nr:hypothetical protein [Candidatus Sabulitectum sp.]
MTEKKKRIELLREPFLENQIGKLPKPTKAQTDEVKKDFRKGIRCDICGGWHHPKVIHLDYVGHAALTDRLLDCDPEWNWEPFSVDDSGQPQLHGNNGMWIKLTVCGVTRMGFGDAGNKTGNDAIKEMIGDALRNAAMRFGAALDLWHKGDLHVDADDDLPPADIDNRKKTEALPKPPTFSKEQQSAIDGWKVSGKEAKKNDAFVGWWKENKPSIIKECSEAGAKLVHAFCVK